MFAKLTELKWVKNRDATIILMTVLANVDQF